MAPKDAKDAVPWNRECTADWSKKTKPGNKLAGTLRLERSFFCCDAREFPGVRFAENVRVPLSRRVKNLARFAAIAAGLAIIGLTVWWFSAGRTSKLLKRENLPGNDSFQGVAKSSRQSKAEAELESLLNSPELKDLAARNHAGQNLTEADWELFLKIGELKGSLVAEPKLVKGTEYPPTTAAGKAMWNWWRQMCEVDPRFEFRRPIEFHGKVVDKAGNPLGVIRWHRYRDVAGAKACHPEVKSGWYLFDFG